MFYSWWNCPLSSTLLRCYFQAYTLDNRNTESLLLKGSALLELKKIQEAILHYREALRVSPHRYEAHKGKNHSKMCNRYSYNLSHTPLQGGLTGLPTQIRGSQR